MSGEDRAPESRAAESAVEAVAETGRVAAQIARGAAVGGLQGAAAAAVRASGKRLGPALLLLLVPLLVVAMLPSVVFGRLLSDGSAEKSGIADAAVFEDTMLRLDGSIRGVLTESLRGTLERIEADFAASGCDAYEVRNPYASGVRFNAGYLVSLYCAARDAQPETICEDDLILALRGGMDGFYTYGFTDEIRPARPEETGGEDEDAEPEEITVRVYTVRYAGEAGIADRVFGLSESQERLARSYAQNLSALLRDGSFQALPATEFTGVTATYDGSVFTDGKIPVVYYCQGDARWKDLPYGTDTIGGYACGPTAMAIVVSSLTPERIDPPAMSRWAYENGHWCEGNGSYQTVITGACETWGLNVEPCARDETDRIRSALRGGQLVVAVMGPGHFTKGGHFIVLRGITSAGKILVADPASYTRSGKEWDLETITDEASTYSLLTAPFWIVGT